MNVTKQTNVVKNEVTINWYLIDAKGKVLGRVATEIAKHLMGKNKPNFNKNTVTGDKVVVINAEQIEVTGNKAQDKKYYSHSGYPGGLTEETFEKKILRLPTRVIESAVKNMLPKNRLRDVLMNNLYVYKGEEHPHTGQI